MRELLLLLFATTGGLAFSGIVANLYRLLARKPKHGPEKAIHLAVMIFAGPSVLFENATTSFRTKACSRLAYCFAVAVSGYWAFVLGLCVIDISTVI